MAKLSHNDMVSMDFIVRICRNLNCTAGDLWISYLKL
ncbi:MAG: helix-turn-helix domain-containing protein [Dorea sp.]|nr:helix-turn-helix domain-containing protein [Dorea sp.]